MYDKYKVPSLAKEMHSYRMGVSRWYNLKIVIVHKL